jgi:mxaC protein
MSMQFSYPPLLFLLGFVVLPWLRSGMPPVRVPSLAIIPGDNGSQLMSLLVRSCASLAIACLCFALAGPYRPAESVTRTGQGAEIMLLLDRSRSMDRPFYSEKNRRVPVLARPSYRMDSKGSVARRVLSEFVAARHNDRFGMLAFSNQPIEILPLTDKQALVQAAIEAGNIGRGLAETSMGAALVRAIASFRDRPYTGSRIIVLISDGAADLSVPDRLRIESMLARQKVSLYWIYIRSTNSVGLYETADSDELAPQQAWHRFFSEMKSPYNVYTAENPQDLKRAVDDVGRLQNLPILYEEIIPRRDLARLFYLPATLMLAVLTLASLLEVRSWR